MFLLVNGELKEVCSAKVRNLGEQVGQAWRLHVHPQDSSKAAYVNRKGEVKWNLQETEVPTVEQSVREDALEVQDIRELGLGWAWFVNDLRAFLPSWQDMELASPLLRNLSLRLRPMCLLNTWLCMPMLWT